MEYRSRVKIGEIKMYKYEFDSNKCWYNKVCKKYDTEECRGNCKRFMEMDYLFYKSNIPKRLQRPIKLYSSTYS